MSERPHIQIFLQELNSQEFIFCGSTRNKRAIDLIQKADAELEVYATDYSHGQARGVLATKFSL